MANNTDDNVMLARWLSGELSERELEEFKLGHDFDAYNKIIVEVDSWSLPELSSDTYKRLKNQLPSEKGPQIIPMYRKAWFMVAASLLLLIGVYFVLNPFGNGLVEYATASGETLDVSLPDNSHVKLNGASRITFNKFKWAESRTVTLTGNAYFEVEKGQTFTVQFENGTVQVLGTRFEILSEPEYFSVFCYEGKVRAGSVDEKESFTLTQGKGMLKEQNLEADLFEDHTKLRPAWENLSSREYINSPLTEVLFDLKNEFNLKFVCKISVNRKFTGTFVHNDQETALKMVFKPMGIKYELKGDTVTLY